MNKVFFFLFYLIILTNAKALTVFDTLYIFKSEHTIAGLPFAVCTFSDSSFFKADNKTIRLNEGDILELHVVNNDTLEHTFTIDGVIETGNIILAGSSEDFTISFPSKIAYRYYSKTPYGEHLGASGIIIHGYENHYRYFWNLFEQNSDLSYEFVQLTETNVPFNYMPDIFTTNLKVHPEIMMDTSAHIMRNVGDTIIITLVNSGKMLHALHFHGYHVKIVYASKNTKVIGWEKDSFGIEIGEVMILELIPNQPGIFPVHEHNLINVTTSGYYPGGMMQMLNIQP